MSKIDIHYVGPISIKITAGIDEDIIFEETYDKTPGTTKGQSLHLTAKFDTV